MAHFHIPKRSKYKAVRTTVDGISFASKKEANRYSELRILLDRGEIRQLEMQPRFACVVNGVKVCTYVADFCYLTDRKRVIEDVKGVKTDVYSLKKKLVEALFPGVVITEV